jgi:hypothetical protein
MNGYNATANRLWRGQVLRFSGSGPYLDFSCTYIGSDSLRGGRVEM